MVSDAPMLDLATAKAPFNTFQVPLRRAGESEARLDHLRLGGQRQHQPPKRVNGWRRRGDRAGARALQGRRPPRRRWPQATCTSA